MPARARLAGPTRRCAARRTSAERTSARSERVLVAGQRPRTAAETDLGRAGADVTDPCDPRRVLETGKRRFDRRLRRRRRTEAQLVVLASLRRELRRLS